jgi:serine/threonine-protein kinase
MADDLSTGPTLPGRPGQPATPGALDARYVVGELLGRGGMGEIRVALDARIGRDVAIKQMRRADPESVTRFLREARVQARLEHPAIPPIHDLGVDDRGLPYFAMKRLAGTTLAAILAARDGRWTRRALLTRLAEVCLAVEFAHRRGVIHRDLKPHNIMFGEFGEVYVLDWGIARIASEREPGADAITIEHGDLDTLESGTSAGTVLGTPGYMPPEQARGEAVDARADVFALGCILLEILAEEPALPHGLDGLDATLAMEALRPARRRPDLDVPPELDDACALATAPDRRIRFATARELHDALQGYLDGDRDLARRRELAEQHAAAAARRFADGDAGRADAMREAGRALALDPGHAGAQALVGRLLLEPPREVPREVEAELRREREAASREMVRAGSWSYVAAVAIAPLLLWLGIERWWPFLGLGLLLAVDAAMLWALPRFGRMTDAWFNAVLVADCLVIAGCGILWSPLVLIPAIAMATMVPFLTKPLTERHLHIVIAMASAVLAPLLLELAGILSRTFSIEGERLIVDSWVLGADPIATPALLGVAHVGLLVATAVVVVRLKHAQMAAEARIHLTAWHLRHLTG